MKWQDTKDNWQWNSRNAHTNLFYVLLLWVRDNNPVSNFPTTDLCKEFVERN